VSSSASNSSTPPLVVVVAIAVIPLFALGALVLVCLFGGDVRHRRVRAMMIQKKAYESNVSGGSSLTGVKIVIMNGEGSDETSRHGV
jgi:hypothetical protein